MKYKDTGFDSMVEAIYTDPLSEIDKDNIFIKALPEPILDEKALISYSTRSLIHYKKDDNMSVIQKRIALNELRELRLFLPFQSELEFRFYESLIKSYRHRKIINIEKEDRLVGNVGDAANSGFSLLGYSGCGKSSAISTLLEKYPQVIIHREKSKRKRFVQIVYLVVSVMPNSNFNALYSQIGAAIDRCLKTDYYQSIMERRISLGQKQSILCRWIEQLGIGTIIFDEIQLMSFDQKRENNFDALMTINNITKVAISVVGTEEAKAKIFSKLQTGRRVGFEISASRYCLERRFYHYIMSELFKYQWFNYEVVNTKEIEKVFYEETKGIIDQTINLYIAIHDEHLKTNKEITPDFIKKVSGRYFTGLKVLLNNIDVEDNQMKISEIIDKAKLERNEEINKLQQKEVINKIVTSVDNEEKIKLAISSIQRCFDYPDTKIYSIAKKVLLDDNSLTPDELTKKVVKILTNRSSRISEDELDSLLELNLN